MAIIVPARSADCADRAATCENGVANALIGGFGFSIPYPATTDPTAKIPVKIFLDDIVSDTEPAPSAP
jgi:hypothetical protein